MEYSSSSSSSGSDSSGDESSSSGSDSSESRRVKKQPKSPPTKKVRVLPNLSIEAYKKTSDQLRPFLVVPGPSQVQSGYLRTPQLSQVVSGPLSFLKRVRGNSRCLESPRGPPRAIRAVSRYPLTYLFLFKHASFLGTIGAKPSGSVRRENGPKSQKVTRGGEP